MGIQVKIISGFNVGREFEFASGEREIKIGRAADADVQLHEDDRNCGRGIHARLLAEDGQWFVEADHDNGVVLTREGKTLLVKRGTRCAVGRNARITLGSNGPQLRLAVKGDTREELAPTLKNDEKVCDMPVGELTLDLADAAASVRPGLRRLGIGIAVVFVLAMLVGAAALIRSEVARRSASRLEGAILAEINSQRADAEARLTALKGAVADIDERTKQNLVEILRKLEPSVVMLALSDREGRVKFVGTGWSVGDKQIATNAHVAQALNEGVALQGLSPVARRATPSGTENIDVLEIQIHPGYEQWTRILADPTIHLRPGATGNAAAETLIVPYDVAVLRTAQDCGPAIPIASTEELLGLKAGEEIGYAGFPSENVFDPQSSPPALLTGRITRLTDFFYHPIAADTALLIHHNLPTVGGASGSPIVNVRGKVIAINSAGSFVGAVATTQQARPTRVPIGFNYGESIEFLRECLSDSADAALTTRNPDWQARLRRFTLPPTEVLDAFAAQRLSGIQQRDAAFRSAKFVRECEHQLTIRAGRAAAAVVSAELPAGAVVLVQACADDRSDIDLEVATDKDFSSIVEKDTSPDAYPQAAFVTKSRGTYWMRVYGNRTNLERPVVTLRVSRLAG